MTPNDVQDQKIKTLEKRVEVLEIILRGNGQIGLIVKVDRVDQALSTIKKIGWLIITVTLGQIALTAFQG